MAGSAYRPGVYPGSVVLFSGELYARAPADAHDAWQANVGGRLIKRVVPGNHLDLIKAPHVEVLARDLRAAIDEALTSGTAQFAAE